MRYNFYSDSCNEWISAFWLKEMGFLVLRTRLESLEPQKCCVFQLRRVDSFIATKFHANTTKCSSPCRIRNDVSGSNITRYYGQNDEFSIIRLSNRESCIREPRRFSLSALLLSSGLRCAVLLERSASQRMVTCARFTMFSVLRGRIKIPVSDSNWSNVAFLDQTRRRAIRRMVWRCRPPRICLQSNLGIRAEVYTT